MENELLLECIINERTVRTRVNPGIVLLDLLRRTEHLTGTKEGCREGDCGACTVLIGKRSGDTVVYKTVNSCLLPVADVYGTHVVTIEGLNQAAGLNPVQQAIVDDVGTQCGFCTPGFIISLTACCIDLAGMTAAPVPGATGQKRGETFEDIARDGVDGNICRCTGHTPIKKAIRRISTYLAGTLQATAAPHHTTAGTLQATAAPRHTTAGTLQAATAPLQLLVDNRFLPEYFLSIAQRLGELPSRPDDAAVSADSGSILVSGGTDLYVQKAFTMHTKPLQRIAPLLQHANIDAVEAGQTVHAERIARGGASVSEPGVELSELIFESGAELVIRAEATIEEIRSSGIIARHYPGMRDHLLLFGSSPIRHRATIAGNIANASPIGDMTCLLMALDAMIGMQDGTSSRTLPLKKLYTGYKTLNKTATELIRTVRIPIPKSTHRLSFEKVSRRQYLDIASVNSAMAFDLHGTMMRNVSISAGGVGPTMIHCANTSALLSGKEMNADVLSAALNELQHEISPISDARGSAGYKRLLLRQLVAAHVMKYFPDAVKKEAFV